MKMSLTEEKWMKEIWPIIKQFEDKCKELKIAYHWENKIDNEYFKGSYNGLEGIQRKESAERSPISTKL
jgi:hypothetical protein